jgi:hypothetical protein
MAIRSLQQTVQNYVASASTAQAKFTAGVQATDKDPTALAVQNQAALLSGFNNAVNSGLWARRTAAVSKAQWQAITLAKAQNYATGVQAGETKYNQKMGLVLPVIQNVVSQVDSMPSGTPAANDQRMLFYANAMRQAKQNGAFG